MNIEAIRKRNEARKMIVEIDEGSSYADLVKLTEELTPRSYLLRHSGQSSPAGVLEWATWDIDELITEIERIRRD